MAKSKLMASVGRTVSRVGFKFKKHSPEILVVVGVAGVVASTVLACKATLKVNEVLDEANADIEKIHTAVEEGRTEAGAEYDEVDGKKDLAIVYAQSGVKFAKLYGPAVVLGVVSVGCIVASHQILRKRNIALAAAFASVDRGFREYRGRVIERFGDEMDRELKYNLKAKEIEEKVVDENGNEKIVKKTVQVGEPERSPYTKCFDEYCINWTKNPEDNLTFLMAQMNYANERLQAKEHLFLNDVYEMLGLPKTKAGQVVGWYWIKGVHESKIDFGIFDLYDECKRDFVNGRERSIWLDFNVDGNILDYI